MALGIGVEVTDELGSLVVSPHGDVDMETAPELDAALAAVDDAVSRVVVDLSDVDFLDSSGITVLVEHWQRLQQRAHPAELRLVVATPAVAKVLDVAGLAHVLPGYASRPEALREP